MITDFPRNHPKVTLAGLVLLVSGVLIAGLSASSPAKQPAVVDPTKVTKVTSPFTHTTIDLEINTALKSDANDNAVHQPFELFGLGDLPFSAHRSYEIHEALPALVAREVVPTYVQTYIHIDASTIKCPSEYDCTFSFYIDSPERYFTYHTYHKPDGSEAHTLRQEPLPGVTP
jgi:hypothetical protein